MLMTKYTFLVHEDNNGYLHTVVTRLSDGTQKYFFQCNGSKASMESFLSSMTDELTEGYFPKPGKKSGDMDNWAFLKPKFHRTLAQARAEIAFKLNIEVARVRKEMGWA